VTLQSLTGSHTSQISYHDGDITALQGRLDTEEQNIIDLDDLTANHTDDIDALQELTAGHTTDIASNTAVNIISTSQFFDTIVLRRPTAINGVGSDRMGVKELQCWVNGVNIMIDNGLTSYFTSWLNKDTNTGSQNVATPSTLAYNNDINDIGVFHPHQLRVLIVLSL
jgi:hypothetical protein